MPSQAMTELAQSTQKACPHSKLHHSLRLVLASDAVATRCQLLTRLLLPTLLTSRVVCGAGLGTDAHCGLHS
jgi:hypothetical protein